MACENPYYDRSSTTGGGGGGSVDLSNYPKKAEVGDYDQVENYTADTKDPNTIYIKDNKTLWVYNGTKYVKIGENKANATAQTVPRYKSTDGEIEETEVIIDSNNNILTTGVALKFTQGLTAGVIGEVNNSLVDFGTNFSQLGNVDNTKDSAFIRVDTRGGSHSTELFTLFHANAGGNQKAIFKIGDNGKVYAKSLDVDGYTRLGASSPAIKMKIISGVTPTTQGESVKVLHGLTASKIVGAYHQVIYYRDERVYNLYDGIGWKTKIWSDEDGFILRAVENESASVLGKPFDIVVMYKE